VTATQLTLDDFLEGLASDPTPRAVDALESIRLAVLAAAADRHGLVHIAAIRRHLPQSVAPRFLGSTVNRFVRRGFLVPTGRYEPNGDAASRNGCKPAPVYRLHGPIPPQS
jgi:hypothetical protein